MNNDKEIIKYHKAGISVIPGKPTGKGTNVIGWSEFSFRLPTDEELENILRQHPYDSIAMITGEASSISALDIDMIWCEATKEFFKSEQDFEAAKKLLLNETPKSPVTRIGLFPKELKFFEFDDANPGSFDLLDRFVSHFGNSHLVMLPPTIHPETKKPYYYKDNRSLLNHKDELVRLDVSLVVELCDFIHKNYVKEQHSKVIYSDKIDMIGPFHHEDKTRCPHGSFLRLQRLALSASFNFVDIDEVVSKLLEFDDTKHFPIKYFSDPRLFSKRSTPMENAYKMARGIKKFVDRVNKKRQESIKAQVSVPVIEVSLKETKQAYKEIKISPPQSNIINELYKLILDDSIIKQTGVALSTSLSIFSTLMCGRYKTRHLHGSYPNINCMNILASGKGKDVMNYATYTLFEQSALSQLNLMGLQSLQSKEALVENLPNQRIRQDVYDEMGSFLARVAGGDIFSIMIASELNKIYSMDGKKYHGLKGVRKEPLGACEGPVINLLCGCQPDVFKKINVSHLYDNGFLGRFIFFIADDIIETNRSVIKGTGHNSGLKEYGDYLFNILGDNRGFRSSYLDLTPTVIDEESDAAELRTDYCDKIIKTASNSIEARQSDKISKLSLLCALGRYFYDKSTPFKITVSDVNWAYELITGTTKKVSDILLESLAESKYDKKYAQVLSYLARQDKPTDRRHIFASVKGIDKRMKDDILNDLLSSGQITACTISDKTHYKLV